ncbi:MAG TPA: hypothetical protein VFI42_05355 [Thermomicrobiaceae bacterium]|nr:hypothetical protein [Thermomicrobiaceae bacterium]
MEPVDTRRSDSSDITARNPSPTSPPGTPLPLVASRLAAAWALLYALYRGYYALGGTIGMFGTPVSESQWRQVNAIGAAILLAAAIAPLVLLRLWPWQRLRPFLLAFCWLVAVGCVMHALIDAAQRVLSLAGLLTIDLPYWATIDRRKADLQDLLWNEPWFLVEGLLWAAIAWTAGLDRSPRRTLWAGSALAAIAALTVVGILSALGVIGKLIVG